MSAISHIIQGTRYYGEYGQVTELLVTLFEKMLYLISKYKELISNFLPLVLKLVPLSTYVKLVLPNMKMEVFCIGKYSTKKCDLENEGLSNFSLV